MSTDIYPQQLERFGAVPVDMRASDFDAADGCLGEDDRISDDNVF